MSSGKKTQTQTTSNQPYKAAQPLVDKGMSDALAQYNSGGLVKPNTMSTVVPYAQQTMQGMNAIQNTANQNINGRGLSGQYQGVINNGGLNTQQQTAVNSMTPYAQGHMNVSTARMDSLGDQATAPSFAQQNLSDVASGKFLGGGDPYFEDVLTRSSEKAHTALNKQAAGLGRYGSDISHGVVAREIGDLQTRARSDQYNRERQAQVQANQMLDQNRLAGLGMGLNAAGMSASTQAGNLDRRMSGATNLFNAGQQGFQNLGAAFDGAMAPSDALIGVGSAYEDLAGRQLNDQLRIANERQNAPLANIQALLAAASGAGSYGTQTQTAQMPGSGFSNVMGGLLGGASLLNGIRSGGILG